ncbi:putative tumor necrosis factor receptor superfamily member EDAR-like [Apostichopus japonicus]|uniref:Putative tumor necrosis factor receptor superfamily member EDAR-like n=1 Tax=Stichopus japonicus TaxID=307972 RepID=A0A2G8LJT7_STIJA|nr:putative tumor necrosis factor receptor superfamily member EDAR-like [Apostichopus japonicus]
MDQETINIMLILLFGLFYSRVMSSAECGETQYYDNETSACQECPKCRAGLELSLDCGWGDGEGGVCQPCEPGTFQSGNDMYCSTCSYCKDRHVIQECSAKQDTECGDCLPKFTFNMNLGMCQPCTTDCPTTTPTVTPSNTPTLQESSPSEMSNNTQASRRFNQGNGNNKVPPGMSYSPLANIIHFCHDCYRNGRTDQRDPSTNDIELHTIGIPGTSDTSSALLDTTSTNSVRSFVSGDDHLQNPGNECGNPPLAEGGQDNNLKHASAIIRINGAIKTEQMKLLSTYLYHGLKGDFKQRHREECSTFSEISTTLEQLDQYSIEKPCVLVLGLCTVGRKDLANDLYRNTRCQKHRSAMCHG